MIVVTLMIMFGQMVAASTKNRMLEAGPFFAVKVLASEINLAEETDRAPAFSNVTGSDLITTTDPNTGTEFLYQVVPSQIGSATYPGETWYVEVKVSWWQSGQAAGTLQSRVGHGKLELTRGRVVYIQRDSP